MFQRFTDSGRRVIVLAQEESRLLSHQHIGVEHFVLALCHAKEEGDRVLAHAMPGVRLADARERVAAAFPRGTMAPGGHLPFTPAAKAALEASLRTALALNHSTINAGHVLLAVFELPDGVAAGLLTDLAVDPVTARAAVVEDPQDEPRDDADLSPVERIEALEAQVRDLTRQVTELRARLGDD
ncbi:MAG TPA: Clp protease N-terminal domain-containing protein [Pseudonocardiaceae bacterium]|jgi:ATP-dependent Clp protease ATP-binding subunit ClpC|nr:Clp protease N-terminal domain-containing protein [Pseudonocardiaceae bacterium]